MFGVKIVVTLLAIIIAAGAAIISNVGGIFGSSDITGFVTDVSPLEMLDNTPSNVSFQLILDDYKSMSFRIESPVDIYIDSTDFILHTAGDLEVHKPVEIGGFTGSIKVAKGGDKLSNTTGTVTIEGDYKSIRLSDITLSGKGNIKESMTEFASLRINELSLSKFAFSNMTGRLTLKSGSMAVDGETVEIQRPSGDFIFAGNFAIDGTASQILLSNGYSISIK